MSKMEQIGFVKMGCCCSSTVTPPQQPRTAQPLVGGNKKLLPFDKYAPLSSNNDVMRKRTTFWDTEPSYSGRLEIWHILKLAAESEELRDAQALLDLENITCPTGRLTDGVYDSLGNHYTIPAYCLGYIDAQDGRSFVNVPEKVIAEVAETKRNEVSFPVTARLSSGQDLVIDLVPSMKIAQVKLIISQKAAIVSPIRLFFLGSSLDDNLKIRDSKLKEKSILQVFVLTV